MQKKDAYECCNLNPLAIGTFYSEGIIASGTIIDNQVMIVDLNDLGDIKWNNGSNIVTGATATALKTGAANTNSIISVQGAGTYAASATRAGVIAWDLPSQDELNELYVNITAINAGISNNGGTLIADTTYWSSSEDGSSGGQFARIQDLNDGSQGQNGKNFTYSVRAVRWVNI